MSSYCKLGLTGGMTRKMGKATMMRTRTIWRTTTSSDLTRIGVSSSSPEFGSSIIRSGPDSVLSAWGKCLGRTTLSWSEEVWGSRVRGLELGSTYLKLVRVSRAIDNTCMISQHKGISLYP